MQTLGRPAEREAQSTTRPRPEAKRSAAGEWLVATVVLAAWCLFVNVLEGFNFDTLFIAVFCTIVTMFVIKCCVSALIRRPRF